LYLHCFVLEGFVADLQVIGEMSTLSQVARLQAAERNGGSRTEKNQMLKEGCEKAGILSHCVRFIECRWLIMWCSVGAAFTTRKGLHRLGKYSRKADVNWH
jgi:hypothetical protein